MSNNEYTIIDNYIFKDEIGEGNFGKVKLCIFKKTGEKFAIKILNKNRIKEIMKNKIFRENKIITKFNHLNIISVFEIIEDKSNYYIIMEYCENGELFDYIISHQKLSEEECSLFFYQLINGVDHIHSKGISHRDLKPENILLTDKNILKIIDFGLSHEFDEENELLNTKCGSPSYASPEIILGKLYNGFKSDIWSCGIILFAMATGYLPFEGETNKILFKEILECKPEIPDYLSEEIKNLILNILRKNPEERLSIEEIKKSEFYLKGKKLFEKKYKNISENKNKNNNKDLDDNIKEKIIKKIINNDYEIEEEKNNNNKKELILNKKKNSYNNTKSMKKGENSHNIFKFLNSKNNIVNFKNRIMNINSNFSKKLETLNAKMERILNKDMNTIITNKINNNSIYTSFNNYTENNQNKDVSNNNSNNKYIETKIFNSTNSNINRNMEMNTYNKKKKLQFHRRNKINNFTPYLKTSETSPATSKLPSYGRGETSSEKIFNLKSNNRNSSSKHSININDTYKTNSKSNNLRLNSENNIELINKFKYYLIGKKNIPKDKNVNKKRNDINTRNIGYKKNSLISIKTHNSNNRIPFYKCKYNYNSLTTTKNSNSNIKDNSSDEENNHLKKLFTKTNNYNKQLIKNKTLSKNFSSSVKSRIKNVKSIKTFNFINNQKIKSNNKNNNIKNSIKSNCSIQNSKNKKSDKTNNNLNDESYYSKSNSFILKSILNSNRNKKINKTNNLRRTNNYINNYAIKKNILPSSSFNSRNNSKKNISLTFNSINSIKKKSIIIHLMSKNTNQTKTKKGLLLINNNLNSKFFHKNRNKDNNKIIKKYYSNHNTHVNSITNLNTNNNSVKKSIYSKDNLSVKYLHSDESESRCSIRNDKHGKDILLTKIKDILKKKNKNYTFSVNSFNSVKNYKKKCFSNFSSVREISERLIKKNNFMQLENYRFVNSGFKYISKNKKEILKKDKKCLNTLNLKNTPSDFKSLYKQCLLPIKIS